MTRPDAPSAQGVLRAQLRSRLQTGHVPLVSVVIPVFNKWEVTRRCLASLAACDIDIALQVIVVDDASSDETPAEIARLPGVDAVRNGTNAGFVDSCNRGARLARGRYVWFLNNDTEVGDGSLRALVERMQSDDRIAITGSQLVYPDGRLQEAGGIIWSDAGGWNYGRLDVAARSDYNFARDVDFISGASLLARADRFAEMGGFDERYAPGYYEDADLCMQARSRGYRVVYEPRSVVTHHEGLTSGTDLSVGMKRFQEINRPKFRAKWADVLARDHWPPDPASAPRAARVRHAPPRGILVVDSYVPMHDREAGSNRLSHLVRGFVDAGERVVFLPDNIAKAEPYTAELQTQGIEVLYHTDGDPRRWREFLGEALATTDVAWVCRPELCRKYLPVIRASGDVPVIYDTIDLHHLRLRRQAEIERTDDTAWRRVEQLELTCGRAADATIVVSEVEAKVLRDAGVEPVGIVPTIHNLEAVPERSYESTKDLIFIGGYGHTPNVDAVQWLVKAIMPIVWRTNPDIRVTLIGANPPPQVRELAEKRVSVTGYVPDVGPYFREARIFVAPIRFGAGVKGKVGQALAYRLPTVTTPVGAEGFGLTHRRDVLVAEDAEAFAAAVIELYTDRTLWTDIAARAAEPLEAFSSERVVRAALAMIELVRASTGRAISPNCPQP